MSSSVTAGDAVKEERKYECEGSFTFVLQEASKLQDDEVDFSPLQLDTERNDGTKDMCIFFQKCSMKHEIGGFDWRVNVCRDKVDDDDEQAGGVSVSLYQYRIVGS